jgi:hypothetical protein
LVGFPGEPLPPPHIACETGDGQTERTREDEATTKGRTMVLFLLYIKAELENVGSIDLKKDASLCLSVRNPLSDFEVREKVVMNATEPVEQDESSRSPAHHLSIKWEGSKKASIMTILDEAAAKSALKKKKGVQVRPFTADDSGNWVPILAVECRGLEPSGFSPMGDDFVVTSTEGTEFREDVDLSDADWAEYDEDNDQSVSLSEIEFKWEAV